MKSSRPLFPWKRCVPTICLLVIALFATSAFGQFSTILHIPPDPDIADNATISSGTQVNLSNGGTIGTFVDAGASDGTSTNIEVNVDGGSVGLLFDAFNGSIVNLSAGAISGGFTAHGGSEVNISGGTLGSSANFTGSTVSVSGGSIGGVNALMSSFDITGGSLENPFHVSDSVVNFMGGAIGGLRATDGSTVEIAGGTFGGIDFADSTMIISGDEFRLDGVPVSGVVEVPDSGFFGGALLSGTLADSTPFAFSPADCDFSCDAATLTLQTTALPPIGPAMITASTDAVPLGIRQGQTLVADNGGIVGDHFNAGAGSTVMIKPGGSVGDNFEVVGAQVTITGGSVGEFFDAFLGSTVDISGGTVGFRFEAHNGSIVNISGGIIGENFSARPGSEVNVSGGSFMEDFSDDFDIRDAVVTISGGSIGDESSDSINLFENAMVNISGGSVGSRISTRSGTTANISGGTFGGPIGAAAVGTVVTIVGGDFRLDEELIDIPGSVLPFNVPEGAVLSGTLVDGTPFAFTSLDSDRFGDGVLTLIAEALPPIGPSLITASTDPVPLGIRQGQMLVVDNGGVVGDHFNAGWGSTVLVEEGGSIGENLETVGAQVTISGGAIGERFAAFAGTIVDITGGEISGIQTAHTSEVNIMGGSISHISNARSSIVTILAGSVNQLNAFDGSQVEVDGGTVTGLGVSDSSIATIRDGALSTVGGTGTVNISGGTVNTSLESNLNGVVTVTGGSISGRLRAFRGTLNIFGGTLDGTLEALDPGVPGFATEVHLIGTQFVLDGLDITSTLNVNDPLMIIDRDVTLSGQLADGSPFSFDLNSSFTSGEDFLDPGAVLTITLVVPGDYNGNGIVDAADYAVWRRMLGQTGAGLAADGDGNFVVDELDYDFWMARFGNTAAPVIEGVNTAAPEPSGTIWALAICFLMALRNRQT